MDDFLQENTCVSSKEQSEEDAATNRFKITKGDTTILWFQELKLCSKIHKFVVC